MDKQNINHNIDYIQTLIHEDKPKLILIGNPNVGKSVFFNELTGSYVDVSNFPGTTIDLTIGAFDKYIVIDTPGVYGISSLNDEEIVTRNSIIHADMVLNIVDSVHLERDLFLTQQIIDMGKPVVVALNMIDELAALGIFIDINLLSSLLGVPVIPTSAIRGEGIDEVKKAIKKGGHFGTITPQIAPIIRKVMTYTASQEEALLLLEGDTWIHADEQIKEKYNCKEEIYKGRREYVNKLLTLVFTREEQKATMSEKFGRLLINPRYGFPILLGILSLVFIFIGKIVAQDVVSFTADVVMGTWFYNFVISATSGFLNTDNFIGTLLIGEYGLLTMIPTYIFGLLLPLVIAFYSVMSFLEDSGILPRIAVLLDKSLSHFGLNGRGIIPIILGFGCITMALITTRILGSKRERLIATTLLCIAVPCSAQFGVIVGIVAGLGTPLAVFYILSMVVVFIFLGILMNKLLPGKSTDLFIDIPPIRVPKLKNILNKTALKSKHFLLDAGPLFVLGSIIVSTLSYANIFPKISAFFRPITESFLHLPEEVTNIFIMGLIRRDFGAAGLNSMVKSGLLTPEQIVVTLVVITLFVPCIASIITLFKEQKPLDAILIWIGSFIFAFLFGGITSAILNFIC